MKIGSNFHIHPFQSLSVMWTCKYPKTPKKQLSAVLVIKKLQQIGLQSEKFTSNK